MKNQIVLLLISIVVFPTLSWGDNLPSTLPTLSAHTSQVHSTTTKIENEFWKDLELVGVIINEPKGKNLAFIEDKKNKHQDVYSINSKIPRGVKVIKILSESILLKKDGSTYELKLRQTINKLVSKKTAYKKISPDEWKINARAMFPGLWDVAGTFKGVKIAKFRRSDGVKGLRVNELSKDHLLKNIGFEEGDIVEKINGRRIDNTSDLIDYLWGLNNQNDVIISLDRQGGKRKLKYHTSSSQPSYSRTQVKQTAQETGLIGVSANVSW